MDEVTRRGQALVLRGDPGIGKSRLLSDTARSARERGMSVLTTAGVQSEAHLPFAGLHQLLRPVRGRAAELPAVQRVALNAAFGLTDDVAPGHFRIAIAALDLVSEIASDAPLLLVVEDAQWLDRPTSDVLAFVARRIESDPIILLAAAREGYPSVLGAFAARVSDLPDATRLVLLVAALNDEPAINEILQAASAIAGTRLDFDVAAPAAEAGVIDLDLQTIRFRHPLIRSAVAQSAGVGERRRVHEALANVLVDHPDRRVWHRAALLSGEHEDIALELEEAGARAQQRGAITVAVTAMRRAGELSGRAGRSRRLLAAAGLAVELGRPDVVVPLLRDVNQLDLGELEWARLTWLEETALARPLGDVGRLTSLISAAERAGATGDHDLHVDLLWLVASRAWWVDPGPEARQCLIEASARLGAADAEDPRVFAIHAYADPWGHAARPRPVASDTNDVSPSHARSCARRAIRSTRLDARREASRRGVSCGRRASGAPSRPRGARSAHPARTANRPTRGGRPVEPRDRPAAVPLPSDDQQALVPRVPEAWHHLAG